MNNSPSMGSSRLTRGRLLTRTATPPDPIVSPLSGVKTRRPTRSFSQESWQGDSDAMLVISPVGSARSSYSAHEVFEPCPGETDLDFYKRKGSTLSIQLQALQESNKRDVEQLNAQVSIQQHEPRSFSDSNRYLPNTAVSDAPFSNANTPCLLNLFQMCLDREVSTRTILELTLRLERAASQPQGTQVKTMLNAGSVLVRVCCASASAPAAHTYL